MAHRLRTSVATAVALGAVAAPAPAFAAGGLNVSPSRIEAKVREGDRVPAVTIANRTGRTVFVSAAASPSGQKLSGLPSFDLSPRSLRVGARRLAVSPPRFRLAPGEARRVRAVAGPRPRGAIASYAVIAFTARARDARGEGAVLQPALRMTANVMLRYPGRARVRGTVVGAHAEQGQERTLRFLARVRNTGNIHFEPRSRLTIFSSAGRVVARRRFPGENVLPGAVRDTALTLTKRLPRGHYRARVVTRDGHSVSVRRFAFRLVGPNELAAPALKILSLPTPTPNAGDDFDATIRVENAGNLAFAPRGTLVLRRHGGAPVAERAIRVDRLEPGDEGTGEVGLPALADGRYELSVRFEHGHRVLAERALVFTTGTAPPLLDRILDWVAAHLPLVLGACGGVLLALAAGWLAHTRRLRRRQARALGLARLEQEEARLIAQREHEARLAALEASLATVPPAPPAQAPGSSGPPPIVVAGVASVVAFLLGGSRARRR